MTPNLKNINDAESDHSPNSLEQVLASRGANVLRDSFLLMLPQATVGGRLTVGYTAVYPGCRTSGHRHADREEVYFITKGHGRMEIDGESFDVKTGDVFYVVPGAFHTLHNTHHQVVEYLWVTALIDKI